jgi:hypothetical protein
LQKALAELPRCKDFGASRDIYTSKSGLEGSWRGFIIQDIVLESREIQDIVVKFTLWHKVRVICEKEKSRIILPFCKRFFPYSKT